MNKLLQMSKHELKKHILDVQDIVQQKLSSGIGIDDLLDETSIFDDFEEIVPDEEFPIFVITILNNYKSDIIMEKLVNSILVFKGCIMIWRKCR